MGSKRRSIALQRWNSIWGRCRLDQMNIEYRMMNTECRSEMLGFAFTSAFYIGCSLFDIAVGQFNKGVLQT